MAARVYPPVAYKTGQPPSSAQFARRRIAIVGDSITRVPYITGTNQRSWADTIRGMLAQVDGWLPIPLGVSSRAFAGWTEAELVALVDPWQPTDIIFPLGTNDVASARTLAQMQADATALWNRCAVRPYGAPRLHACSIMPLNAAGAPEADRILFNYNWLLNYTGTGSGLVRGGGGTLLWGVVDLCTFVARATAPNWTNPDLTIDLVHPTTEGGRLLARYVADYFLADDF